MIWWLLGAALAGSPALDALDEGDAAWFSGERRLGARAWRRALALCTDSQEDRAVEAMVRLRLLRAGSTLSPLWQGPRINRALDACGAGPWCTLALVDFHLFAPEAVGADRRQGLELARRLEGHLPVRAASRSAWATGEVEPLRALEAPPDGLGLALLAGLEPDPGPWTLGLGLVAAAAPGVGLGAHIAHPDLGRRRIRGGVDGWVATHSGGADAWLRTPGTWGLAVDARAARWRWWDGTDWQPTTTARLAPGVGWRPGKLRVEAGPLARWDLSQGELLAGHGAWYRLSLDGRRELERGVWAGLSGEVALPPLADYPRQGARAEVRGWIPAGSGVLAGRTIGEAVHGDEIPDLRLPTVGGSGLLRGAQPGQLRGDWTAGAELELRHPVVGPLWLAAFGGAAVIEGQGLHGGGGGGIRWVLPPRPHNSVRLDVGWTDVGWDLVVGWGEAI